MADSAGDCTTCMDGIVDRLVGAGGLCEGGVKVCIGCVVGGPSMSHLLFIEYVPFVVVVVVVKDEEAMEFSTLAKAFGRSDEVCRCILKSEILKASRR